VGSGSWEIRQLVNQREQAAAYEAPLSSFEDQAWRGGLHWCCWCFDLEQVMRSAFYHAPKRLRKCSAGLGVKVHR
jgi:hypothetical protein